MNVSVPLRWSDNGEGRLIATITTLRPSSTSSGVGWTPSTGTLHGVTSDNSDATYATWSGDGSPLILATPADSPPAGERRHQVRLRARGEDGNAWWAVRLSSGALAAGAAAEFPASPTTVTGSWGFGAPPDGSTVLYTYVTGQSTGVRITELYIDMDSREAPTFTPQTLDGSGSSTTTISDTATPTVRADAIDLDGLAARQYRYWVTQGATIVWDTGIVSGSPANRQTTALDNGAYTAHLQIWSTLGANTAYPSDEETLAFTVLVGEVASPDNPTVDPVDGTPFYELTACAPYVDDLDGGVGYVEIQRVDCPGEGQTLTSIAMLGPLESDECATWTDFTLPRSGVGRTCDHEPDQCCSYYRARTVGREDGDLRVSDWSDAYNPGIPMGVIVMWPGADADVPEGWSRTTELDGKYPKGVPDGTTQPGTTGGADTHSHTLPTHIHDTAHSHTVTGNTGTATGTSPSTTGAAGTTAALSSHTHTRPAVNSATFDSGATTPGSGTGSNDPARAEVIFMESDGSPLGVPDGAAALTLDVALSGWADSSLANTGGRYLKGAAAAGDGGTTAASAVASHTHSINAHTHTGTSHTHGSSPTGSFASDRTLNAGATTLLWTTSHSHSISVGNATSAALSSGGSGSSGASGQLNPPFRQLRLQENTSGVDSLPVGLIGLWRGSIGSIPDNWALCDGTGGTPDMFGLYPRATTDAAVVGDTGGSLVGHDHTSPGHTHTTSGHAHTETIGPAGSATAAVSNTNTVTAVTGTHTHSATNTDSTTPTVNSSTSGTLATTTTEPPFEEVAFIQMMEEPAPPVDPEVFCLTWDEDEHLIRSTGPAGPVWAPILGKFEWEVDRPFTAATGLNGSRFVTSAPPGGRNLKMSAAVESEAELAQLRAVLARPLVLISPSDADEVWAAPVAESVRIIKIGRIRQVSATFVGTGPQPPPQLADVGV